MNRSLVVALMAAPLLFGCPATAPSAPDLTGMSPSSIPRGQQPELTLSGHGFHARIHTELDRKTATAELPRVTLVQGDHRLEAEVVELVSDQALRLHTPADLSPGAWDVVLVDPWNRRAELKGALTVTDCGSDSDCDDAVPCTVDVCDQGVCGHPVPTDRCVIDGECVPAGAASPGDVCHVCNPAVSQTRFSAAEEGTGCDDGDLCTIDDACHSGACAGAPKCSARACEVAACEPATGECGTTLAADASPCDDWAACTSGDHCESGVCVGAPVCDNTPPLACLHLSLVGAVRGGTVTFDASCSSDQETPVSNLEFRFDFDGDGNWDTQPLSSPIVDHVYSNADLYIPVVEVRDPGGLSGYAKTPVSVGDRSEDVVVTTAADEDDADASPSFPGHTGLSLREAITFINENSEGKRIRFLPGLKLTCAPLPALAVADVKIVGEPDVEIDFAGSGAGTACLTLDGQRDSLIGLKARGCNGQLVDLRQPKQRVFGGRFEGSSPSAAGIRIKGTEQSIGPGTELSGFGDKAIESKATDGVIDGVRIHDSNNGIVIMPPGVNTRIDRSVIYANTLGVDVRATTTIRSCVIDGNSSDGIIATGSQTLTVRDALLTRNGRFGLNATAQTVVTRDTNGYFGNAAGALSGGQQPAANDVTSDPQYLAPMSADYRLGPGSPASNAGVDLGLDLNGAAPNRYNESAPDLGAEESPW